MNLNELTQDTMRSLLNYLVDSKMISEELIKKALKGAVPTEMKRMTDIIHQLLCKQTHDIKMPADDFLALMPCRYYEEELCTECWAQEEHEYWLNITTEIMEKLQLTNEDQLRRELTLAKAMNTKLHDFKMSEPKAYQLLMKINGWEQT